MNSFHEKRQSVRYKNTPSASSPPWVGISVDGVTEGSIEPEDFSSGGFRLVVPKEPEMGISVLCTIEIWGRTLTDCPAKVAWVSENDSPNTWAIGIAMTAS